MRLNKNCKLLSPFYFLNASSLLLRSLRLSPPGSSQITLSLLFLHSLLTASSGDSTTSICNFHGGCNFLVEADRLTDATKDSISWTKTAASNAAESVKDTAGIVKDDSWCGR